MNILGVKVGIGLLVVAAVAAFIGYKYGARVVAAAAS